MAEPQPNFAKQSSARRAQWKEKPKDFISMAEPQPHFAKQSSARRAQWEEKPRKVREKKEKPQGFAFSFPNCRRLYSKAAQSERKERKTARFCIFFAELLPALFKSRAK
ncbi:MAG: hypothetical protein SPE09_01455 [Alloprevotella sp.]|nr:hypothetical protein [Alloprevotella sp.]